MSALATAETTPEGIDFSRAGVVVYDPQGNTLPVLRDALRNLGFRKIVGRRDLGQLQQDLGSAQTNLVIVDIDTRPAETLGLVRDIRYRRAGADPFVGVMTVSWGVPKKNVGELMNSGTDDVLIKPMSFESVRGRLLRMVCARKPFVGAPHYIGPDRRAPDRTASSEIKLLKVPNTLRDRALRSEQVWSPRGIEDTYRAISMQQVQRMGVQIRDVATSGEADASVLSSDDWRAEVAGVQGAVSELGDHLGGQGYEDLVRLLGIAYEAVEDVLQSGVPTTRQLDVLRLHGEGLLAVQRSRNVDVQVLEEHLRKATAVVREGAIPAVRPTALH